MATSQNPIMANQWCGERNGIQETVLSTKGSARESPNGFNDPNQMKMSANDRRVVFGYKPRISVVIC